MALRHCGSSSFTNLELTYKGIGTFSTESFHGDGDVGGRKRLGRGRRCSRQKCKPLAHFIFPTATCRVLFKTCREILLLSFADNNISGEEFVPLYDCYRSKKSRFWLSIERYFRSRKHPNFEFKLRWLDRLKGTKKFV